MRHLAILLLLSGCATTDNLWVEYAACVNAKGECEDLRKEIALREKARMERENARPHCPPGTIAVCDSSREPLCGRTRASRQIQYVCMDHINIWR